jgi:quinol monooxygenase YgiN
MSATVHVIARLTARPEAVAELQALLLGLIEPTRQESGCLRYTLLRNAADPTDDHRAVWNALCADAR